MFKVFIYSFHAYTAFTLPVQWSLGIYFVFKLIYHIWSYAKDQRGTQCTS